MDIGANRPDRAVELRLGPDARSAGEARRFLSSALQEWRATAYRDDAILLLSELVANAALHANTQILVQIELQSEYLRLAVTDQSPRQPVMRHYSEQSTTGRGLALVSALATRWGIDPQPDGKTVWAEVAAASQGNPVRRSAQDHVVDLDAFPDLDEPTLGRLREDEETTSFLQAA